MKVKTFLKVTVNVIIILILLAIVLNLFVILPTIDNIASESRAKNMAKEIPFDAIVVLGCSAKNGVPSHMLQDRLDTAIKLYESGVCDTILMSGDESVGYSEVQVMYNYAVGKGVPGSDVIVDAEGFSTFDSMRRLRDEFAFTRVVVVTQKYHAYRAVYIGEKFGIETIAVSADVRVYKGQFFRDVREVGARIKDIVYCIFR